MTHPTSRERVLTALAFEEPDHPPCAFSAYQALEERSAGLEDFVLRQIDLGLDVVVRIPDPPIGFAREVRIREGKLGPGEPGGDPRYPLLICDYETPAGTIGRRVRQTPDWPDGDHVPFYSDHTISRATKHLVTAEPDLGPLGYLLRPPSGEEIERYRASAAEAKRVARTHGLAVSGGTSQHADFACWLTGIEELTLLTLDDPGFVSAYLDLLEAWNRARMEVVLEEGVDIFLRRGWYENADFWPPDLYREFLLPGLRRDAEQVHAAGARFAYIMSCSSMPLVEMLIDAGVDILLGVDPAQDRMMDLAKLKAKSAGRLALWGGVCGYLTVERGEEADVRREVREALTLLSPGGGFILAPVTNVRSDTERVRSNVEALIDEWRQRRETAEPGR